MKVFVSNKADSPTWDVGTTAGGSLYAVNNCSVSVHKSYFYRNIAYWGYTLGGSIAMHNGSVLISRSILKDNHARYGGGFAYLSESVAVFDHNVLTHNSAEAGCGIIHITDTSVNIHTNIVTNNHASKGGVLCTFGNSSVMMKSCLLSENAAYYGLGGAIYVQTTFATISIQQSTFRNNSALNGGVMSIQIGNGTMVIESCTIKLRKMEGLSTSMTLITAFLQMLTSLTQNFLKILLA